MKSNITVVGAAIVKDGKILALRRADGDDEVVHKFEFAGGKVEEGETPEQALKRECMEELSLDIEVGDLLNTINYDYPNTTVCLSVYFVKPLSDYKLTVHEEERWFDCANIDSAEWAPADKAFLNTLKKGYIKIENATECDYEDISAIAETVGYMCLSAEKIKINIAEYGYNYKIIYLNGEPVGYYGFCPAKNVNLGLNEGTFFGGMYLKEYARGKKLTGKVLSSIQRPVYTKVGKDDVQSVNIFKHFGFKIMQAVKTENSDEFLMALLK